ncbi:MAG: ATP-binding protein [Lachnospiraceae bacterium]
MRETELILYTDCEEGSLLQNMSWLMENYDSEFYNREDKVSLLYECFHDLMSITAEHGFYGNLWHCYLTNLCVNHENAYSTACEIVGTIEGSINELALHDFTIFKEYFEYDFTDMFQKLQVTALSIMLHYEGSSSISKIYNDRIRTTICTTAVRLDEAKNPAEMKDIMTGFYRSFGVGKFGLHKAFRIIHKEENDQAEIIPILRIAHVHLDDLIGYEIAKQKLIDNTEAFVQGKKANNCLLFGDAGTGKSSSIKAIVNEYYDRGLRIIEVYKHQFKDLNDVIAQVKNRHYKFIIYMDDLSFEEFEIEYKYLKAVIEGGMEKKPDNVLIYATSNRRHLIKENYADKDDRREEDMHSGDTVQEKLSLVARFGVSIFFGAPTRAQFQTIVKQLAKKNQVRMSEPDLLAEANKWELSHGGLSGRTAQQFIDYLLGRQS